MAEIDVEFVGFSKGTREWRRTETRNLSRGDKINIVCGEIPASPVGASS